VDGIQSPYTQRHLFAEALAPLGFTHKDVRVITPVRRRRLRRQGRRLMEIIGAALATLVKGRPVKLRWTREQEFYNTYQRQGVVAELKIGVMNDGTITAVEHELYWDAGAYVEYGANVVNAAGLSATGPYRVPNIRSTRCASTPTCRRAGRTAASAIPSSTSASSRTWTASPRRSAWTRWSSVARTPSSRAMTLSYGAPMNPSGMIEAIDKVARRSTGASEESDNPNPS
jgi:CO/xanthine dehydrogenase Mo-binding subunit